MSTNENVLLETILIKIGFLPTEDGLQFDFGNCKLKTIKGMSPQLFYGITFLGYWKTNRSMGQLDFSLPLEVESFEQGIALIAYNLRKAELKIKPNWLIEGLSLSELLLWEIEKKKYRDNPRAIIDHEWFRIIVKKLLEASKNSTEDAVTTFSFVTDLKLFVRGGVINGRLLPQSKLNPWIFFRSVYQVRMFRFLFGRINFISGAGFLFWNNNLRIKMM